MMCIRPFSKAEKQDRTHLLFCRFKGAYTELNVLLYFSSNVKVQQSQREQMCREAQNEVGKSGRPFKVYSRRPKEQKKDKGIFGSLKDMTVAEIKEDWHTYQQSFIQKDSASAPISKTNDEGQEIKTWGLTSLTVERLLVGSYSFGRKINFQLQSFRSICKVAQ